METNNVLTANSPIHKFSDEQIKDAMGNISGNSPLYHALGLIEGMSNYIIFNDAIDEGIRDTYFKMSRSLEFYLDLLKIVVDYQE